MDLLVPVVNVDMNFWLLFLVPTVGSLGEGRGVCPSCNTRHMAETAAHLVDHVFPKVPVRQWVLSLLKRLRYYLYHNPQIATKVLKIFLDEIAKQLKQHQSIPSDSKVKHGGVSFIHRFGASLNVHLHFHCVVIEGLFIVDGENKLSYQMVKGITEQDILEVQERVRQCVLKGYKRWQLLEDYEVDNMKTWLYTSIHYPITHRVSR